MALPKQLSQQLGKALRILREVEPRPWHEIWLAGDITDEVGEARQTILMAQCFRQFCQEFPRQGPAGRQEAYAVLKAAYANARFARRQHLSKEEFGWLLDIHLDNL